MRQTSVGIHSGKIVLEGVFLAPDAEAARFPGVVLCHPHPLFGGDMSNAVLVSAASRLVHAGFAALLFNFRGVGGSQGEHAKGEREGEDVEAALEFLHAWPKLDSRRVGLMGYSFGAAVALGDLGRTKAARAMAFVAPAVPALQRADLGKDRRPMLFVVGERDKIAPSERVREVLGAAVPTREVVTVAGADHSLRGSEAEVARVVTDFFARVLS